MDWRIIRTGCTSSTNSDLASLAAKGAEEGLVLCAEKQLSGRGRQGRRWHSPEGGGLYFSFLARPAVKTERAVTLPVLAGIALASALEKFLPAKPLLKWPNDVLVSGRKIAGILCEMHSHGEAPVCIIAGIGLNVNLSSGSLPAEIASTATSLFIETGEKHSLDAVLEAVLDAFGAIYPIWTESGLEPFSRFIREHDALFGKEIAISLAGDPVSGRAQGISSSGALLLSDGKGAVREIFSGEAHILTDGNAR